MVQREVQAWKKEEQEEKARMLQEQGTQGCREEMPKGAHHSPAAEKGAESRECWETSGVKNR